MFPAQHVLSILGLRGDLRWLTLSLFMWSVSDSIWFIDVCQTEKIGSGAHIQYTYLYIQCTLNNGQFPSNKKYQKKTQIIRFTHEVVYNFYIILEIPVYIINF